MRSLFCLVLFSSCLMKLSLSSPAADVDDAYIMNGKPEFRKDYTVDKAKLGWFKLHQVPATWHEARDRCELEGAELAFPLNAQILKEMLSKMGGIRGVFVGTHSIFSYGDYYSIKGVPLEEMPVIWSNLLSSDNNKRCVVLTGDGTIYNDNCYTATYPYICYKYNDFRLLTECGTFDSGYTLNRELSTCYKLHPSGKVWSNAFKTCSAEGGHLVVINSNAELKAVLQLFHKDNVTGEGLDQSAPKPAVAGNTGRTILAGFMDWQESGQWVTIHGAKLENSGFPTWKQQVPCRKCLCGALNYPGTVSAVACSNTGFPFVCEKKPASPTPKHQFDDYTLPEIDI